MIIVSDYDPNWPSVFLALKASIMSELADITLAVEHVGSTAVPGLSSKAVIDMDVVVAPGDVAEGIERLAKLGYKHTGDLGIPMREAFLSPVDSAPHHLYLCQSNSPALANHVALRDYLRANSKVAQAYGELKARLAIEHAHDIDAYVEGKTAFIVSILQEVGFSPTSLSDVTAMNRKKRDTAQ
jgi:GrpB-like predicted nucleotidyltransferase (UPF0157 family)